MAIVRKYGRPDLFVTFTCNLTWPEILNALENRQRPENRPDTVVRISKMKLTELLDDILKINVFGKVIAYIHAIEFQKRGLPHAHILLTLDPCSKIRNKDDIDSFLCAELPNQSANPRLFEILSKCLIHGPCGTVNPNSPCMRDGTCSKNFPKALNEATEENVNGYPIYQRRAREPVKVEHEIDNRWIVPYNPRLIRLQSNGGLLNNDEILTLLDSRYASDPEAMWRLNEFSLRKISCNHEVGCSLAKPTASCISKWPRSSSCCSSFHEAYNINCTVSSEPT
ncbi:hypothetical protein AVEN_193391-1 [Araneus ventricosus]|uniref:Helitron helicase-like domain-containing protein n=1 Tax=Araneus ventricosus TaxID=182803 RepID=A0A4Y2F8S4_ARAVE|nr:hypothetical protein AVEN_193391-1 [Araneus ventricosus]